MKQVLHNIRNRPPHHRDRIIWISALVAIAILLIIWMIVGNGRTTTNDDKGFFQTFQQGIDDGKNLVPAPTNQ